MPASPNDTSTLRDTTQQLLNSRPRTVTLKLIEEQTGLSLDFLTHFGAGNRPNASVDRVQKLYEFLSGKPLL